MKYMKILSEDLFHQFLPYLDETDRLQLVHCCKEWYYGVWMRSHHRKLLVRMENWLSDDRWQELQHHLPRRIRDSGMQLEISTTDCGPNEYTCMLDRTVALLGIMTYVVHRIVCYTEDLESLLERCGSVSERC